MNGVFIRGQIFAVLFALVSSVISSVGLAEGVQDLKIYTGSGAYKISQTKAFFEPFEKTTGTKIEVFSEHNGLDLLKNWFGQSSAHGDVINLTSYEAEQACDKGWLVSFQEQDIAPGADGSPIMKDFLGNSLMDCAVPNVAWSALMVVKHTKFDKQKPRSWADFFNAKKFAGQRSLKKSARFTLEMALLADGVAPSQIYDELATIKGQKRAFGKLDTIKDLIVWWETGQQAIDNLGLKDVSMGTSTNGRLFNAMIADGLDVTLVWQGQIYDYDYWGIPLKTAHRDQAMAFVKFATTPEQLAAQSSWMPYGPMRASALKFVKEHEIGKMHMAPYLTTTKAHFRKALKFEESWWRSEAGQEVEKRFESWLNGSVSWPEE